MGRSYSLLLPFNNNPAGNQGESGHSKNDKSDSRGMRYRALIEDCVQRDEHEKQNADLSYAFPEQLKPVTESTPSGILRGKWGTLKMPFVTGLSFYITVEAPNNRSLTLVPIAE